MPTDAALSDRDEPKPNRAALYTLFLLTLINALSLIDRKIPFVMIVEMKREFALSDVQIGLLGGFLFTVVYSVLGFPLAVLADRVSRKLVLTGSLAFWSAMTSLSGFSGNFIQLAFTRLGLAAGEAGCVPASQAIIADLYPARYRGAAMAIYMTGAAIGVMGGLALGGWLVDRIGWRHTLQVVGLFGLMIALLCTFTLKTPASPRATTPGALRPSLVTVIRFVWNRPAFLWLTAGGAFFTAGTAPILIFAPTYLIRSLHFSTAEAGLYIGGITGVAGGAGTLIGGWLSSILSRRDPRTILYVAATGLATGAPCLFFAFHVEQRAALLVLLSVPLFLASFYVGPGYGFAQGIVPASMRATGAALMVFVIHGIGASAGPLLVGAVSDRLAPTLGINSLRQALLLPSGFYLLAATCLLMATRTLRENLTEAESDSK